jgi:hypothetical protein
MWYRARFPMFSKTRKSKEWHLEKITLYSLRKKIAEIAHKSKQRFEDGNPFFLMSSAESGIFEGSVRQEGGSENENPHRGSIWFYRKKIDFSVVE